MRIGIDARPLTVPLAGIGHYLRGMLSALSDAGPPHEYILYAHRPITVALPKGRWHVRVHRGMKGTGPIWLQLHGGRLARADGVELFWGAHFLLPLTLRRPMRAVMTVYDLVPFLHPQTMEFTNYLIVRLLLPLSLARADHVTVISQTAADDMQRLFRLPAEHLSVIPPGVGAHFHARPPVEVRAQVRQRFGIEGPYLLAVGTLEPRKNFITVIRALGLMPEAVRREVPLLVAGARGWKASSLVSAAAPLEAQGVIRFLGYVPDPDLPWLYAGARALVFPSLYEGFGMPVIEAMACGTPVIASDIPVLREVTGQAAMLVAPLDVPGWAEAMAAILGDDGLCASLAARGAARVGRFTFASSAHAMLALWERLSA